VVDDRDVKSAGETTNQPANAGDRATPQQTGGGGEPPSSSAQTSAAAPDPFSPQEPRAKTPLTDGARLWDEEAGAAAPAADLALARLDANEKLFVPFTTAVERVHVHYLDFLSFRGYVRCNGAGCALCRIRRAADVRDLLPVYDPLARAIVVIPVSPSQRPQALRPKLHPVLHRVQRSDAPVVVGIRRVDQAYHVSLYDLPDGADDGAVVVSEFRKQLDAGRVDLAAVYQQLPDEEIANLPEVATALQLLGGRVA
jgi:hypothetical protein